MSQNTDRPDPHGDLIAALRAWCEEQTRTAGGFSMAGAAREGFASRDWIRRYFIKPLVETGEITRLPGTQGFRWSGVEESEIMGEAYETFCKWAAEQTRIHGRFALYIAKKEGLGDSRAIRRFADRALSEGLAAKLGATTAGYEWLGVEVQWNFEASRSRNFLSTSLMEALQKEFLEWGHSQDSFTQRDVVRRLHISHTLAQRLIDPFLEKGDLIRLSRGHGCYAWKGRIKPKGTLADLVEAAIGALDEDLDLKGGSKPRGEMLTDGVLTKTQLRDLKGAANRIARELGFSVLYSVSLSNELFSWNSELGEGDWEIVDRMRHWTRRESSSNRRKLVTGTRILVHFAVVTNMIQADHAAARAEVYAAEWQAFIDTALPLVIAHNRGRNEMSMRKGLEMLALAATRRGELSVETTNWDAIRDEMKCRIEREPGTWRWTSARRVYRHLTHLDMIPGPPWPKPQRLALVPAQVIKKTLADRDLSTWTTRKGEKLGGFSHELSQYIRWATSDPLELSLAGLPPHDFVDPNQAQVRYKEKMERQGRGESLFKLEDVTLLGRLHWLNRYLGWMEDFDKSISLAEADTDDILEVRRLMAFEKYMRAARKESTGRDELPRFIVSLANALAIIASPFLERYRTADGDLEGAARARETAKHLRQFYRSRKKEVRQRKDLTQIMDAWRGSDGVEPWLKLLTMRELELDRAAEAVGMSLEEQVVALRNGDLEPNQSWAIAIRNAFLVNFVRLIPLRRWALSRLTTEMWVMTAVDHEQMQRKLKMHEGAISLKAPGWIMKNKQDFSCPYIEKSVVGSRRHEFGARRELLALYFAEGGAREFLLRLRDGTLIDSPYLFVAPASRVGGRDPQIAFRTKCRWSERKMSVYFHTLVLKHAEALNLDIRRLLEIGGTMLHIVRGIFGSYHAPRDLVMTADILHHGNVMLTKDLYCENKAETAKREAPEEFIYRMRSGEPVATDRMEDLMERLRHLEKENASLQQRVESAEVRDLKRAS